MVNHNIQMRKKNNGSWDNLYPFTTSENVKHGNTVVKDEIEKLNKKDNELSDQINEDKTEFNSKINSKRDKLDTQNDLFLRQYFSVEFELDGSGINPCWLQGACVVPNGNVVFALISQKKSNNVRLIEVDTTSFKMIREKTLPLGHANDLEYIPKTGKILCSPLVKFIDDIETEVNEIYEIDYMTFNLDRTIKLETPASGISYDTVTGQMAYKWAYRVYLLNDDFTVKSQIDCEPVPAKTVGQAFALHNNKIYFNRTDPELLGVWDMNGKLERVYNFPRYSDEGEYFNETESLNYMGNNEFLFGFVRNKDEKKTHSVVTFFIGSTVSNKNVMKYRFAPHARKRYNSREEYIYVDNSYDKLDSDGSFEKPYKDLHQAINTINDPNLKYYIHLKKGNYGYTSFVNINANINITGEGMENTSIDKIVLFDTKRVEMSDVKITGEDDTVIRTTNSELQLSKCGVDSKAKGGFSVSNSRLIIREGNKINVQGDCIYSNNQAEVIIHKNNELTSTGGNNQLFADGLSKIIVSPSINITKERFANGGVIEKRV